MMINRVSLDSAFASEPSLDLHAFDIRLYPFPLLPSHRFSSTSTLLPFSPVADLRLSSP